MKRILLQLTFLTLAFTLSFSVRAQTVSHPMQMQEMRSALAHGDWGNGFVVQNESVWQVGDPLPASVSVPGADLIPVSGHLQQPQSDGRALHNIQVDPSNPMNVHAVIMELSSDYVKDSNLLSRRVYYTFSSDGGKTWKTPEMLTDVKTGFPCMVLYKRNGQYVPIIAAHRLMPPIRTPDTNNTPWECALWVEKGNPGDGNFEMTECGTSGTYGALQPQSSGILWPYIAVSPDGSTVYMVGSVSYTNTLTSDYLKFGTFSLDATGHATWNGWNTQIGDHNGNHPFAGFVQTGDYVLRVSPSGKLGLLWRSADAQTPDADLYFIESTDGGTTWPQNFEPIQTIVPLGTSGSTQIYSGPWEGMDFFYSGENAKILWSNTQESFSNDTNFYYPSVMSLHLYDVASGNDYELVSNIVGTAQNPDTSQYNFHNMNDSLSPYPVGSHISESDNWLSYPVLAPSIHGDNFAVFYQTFVNTDSVNLNDTVVKLYGTIYYQTTSDGGATWSAPAPLHANPSTPNTFGKTDYRWPETSDWNGAIGNPFSFVPTLMYGADTAAGSNAKNGAPDWDVVNFFHDTLAATQLGVQGNAAPNFSVVDYPNPFKTSTKVSYVLPVASNVLLTVSDQLGRTVATLANGVLGAGVHEAVFNAADFPNGVYRYTLQAEGQSVTKSMTLLR